MGTARQFIQGALEALQVYEPGETVLPADLARGFTVLNQMLDSFSNESLSCFARLEQSAPLVAGTSSYSIGPGGDFDMPRPIRIMAGPGAAYLVDSNSNRYGVNVVEQDQWNRIPNVAVPTSNIPDTLFYDPQMPRGTIKVYPVPNLSGVTLYWDSWLTLGSFPSVSTQLQLPPGYELFIETNLALQLERYYPSAKVSPGLVKAAKDSMATIKRSNNRERLMSFDRGLAGRGGVYNPYSDSQSVR